MKDKRLIFYDFEVFKYDWLVVICEYNSRKGKVIVNDRNLLEQFYNYFKEDIWIGYNSRGYDQYIFKGLLLGINPYFISQQIIEKNKKGHEVVKDAWKIPLNNFDITTGFHSLKQLEAFMGSKIKESSVSFNIDRPLTPEEINEVIEYCKHDVSETIKVFEKRREEFDSQLALIEAFNLDMKMFNKTKAQLSAHILGAIKEKDRGDEFDLSFPPTLKINKYQHIVDWYKNPENLNYKSNLKVDVANVPHVFAWGGLHGSLDKYQDEGIILAADVASLYPSIMINYGYISRNVKDKDKYKKIRDERLRLKAEKNPMQLPYKIVLNSTYGAMKDQYNNLYDPLNANNVCIAGQLLLLDLIEKIEPYCKLLQSNTDGIFIKVEKESDIDLVKNIAKEWETRTGLELEWDRFKKLYQKDVNNYVLIREDGSYKSKGAYVKKLNDLDYDLPIVNKALINYFIHNIPIEETILPCDELREFQKVVKISNKYLYALHGEEKLPEKVLRVFADKRENAKTIFKVKRKLKDGIEQEVPEKIGNTPEKCFINNEDIKGVKVPDYLDKEYYVDLAKKRLNDFLGIKLKK